MYSDLRALHQINIYELAPENLYSSYLNVAWATSWENLFYI